MTTNAPETTKKSLFGWLGRGKAVFGIAIVLGLLATVGVFSLLSNATATTTYYVLNQDVAARKQITPEMLSPVTTSAGGQPGNAYDVLQVRDNVLYAKVALDRGDVISTSVAGPADRMIEEVPDDYVAASITVTADNAVAGKIKPGDYIDVIAQRDDEGGVADRLAKIVLSRVYVLDVSPGLETLQVQDEAAVGEAAQQGTTSAGLPSIYTVAVPPQDAVTLAQVRDKSPYVVLSSSKYSSETDAQEDLSTIFDDEPVESSSSDPKTK